MLPIFVLYHWIYFQIRETRCIFSYLYEIHFYLCLFVPFAMQLVSTKGLNQLKIFFSIVIHVLCLKDREANK